MTWEINAFDAHGSSANAQRATADEAADAAANFLNRGWEGVVIRLAHVDPISITFPNGETLTLRSVL